jgi:uncharacterized alkaline shock family protein YloU
MSCKQDTLSLVEKDAGEITIDVAIVREYIESIVVWKKVPEKVRKALSEIYFNASEIKNSADVMKGGRR